MKIAENNTKTLNKKKVLMVLLFIIIVIYMGMLIRKTFSRYQSTATSEAGVDVAFWIVSDTIQAENVAIEGLGPGETKECVFQVSNTNGTIRTNATIEYKIILTTTTNLPLTYDIYQKNESGETICEVESERLYQDDDGTYYKELVVDGFELGCLQDETETFALKATFPGRYDDVNLADLVECVNLQIDAKQKISE